MKNANEHFSEYNSTDSYYKHWLGFVYTDGMKALCEHCQSYWLMDIVGSYQTENKIRAEPFQVWELTKVKGNEFEIVATDGNKNILTKQIIPFSDFPFDCCTIWLSDGVLLLPSEY